MMPNPQRDNDRTDHLTRVVRSQEFLLILIGGSFMNFIWSVVLGYVFAIPVFLALWVVVVGMYLDARRDGRHW